MVERLLNEKSLLLSGALTLTIAVYLLMTTKRRLGRIIGVILFLVALLLFSGSIDIDMRHPRISTP
jgi:hypothetical protein